MSEVQRQTANNAPRVFALSTMALAAITLAGAGCSTAPAAENTMPESSGTTSQNTETAPAPATETSASTAMYKDGTYTVVGNYQSPAGAEDLGVTLTLAGDVVTDASAEVKATNTFSINWQNTFANNFKTLVVGKKISEVELTKVSGSSLTPMGFNDAVAKIKVQAKS